MFSRNVLFLLIVNWANTDVPSIEPLGTNANDVWLKISTFLVKMFQVHIVRLKVPFVRGILGRPMDSPNKGPVLQRACQCRGIIISLSLTLTTIMICDRWFPSQMANNLVSVSMSWHLWLNDRIMPLSRMMSFIFARRWRTLKRLIAEGGPLEHSEHNWCQCRRRIRWICQKRKDVR